MAHIEPYFSDIDMDIERCIDCGCDCDIDCEARGSE